MLLPKHKGKISSFLLQILDKQQQAVCHVDFADAVVKVEREQVELGEVAFQFVLHTSTDDVVGYAAEGLQAHYMSSTAAHCCDDLGWEQPTFAKLRVEVDDMGCLVGHGKDVMEGAVVAERGAQCVDTRHLLLDVAVCPLT